jgi:prevent-host-death family protein
MRRVGAREFKNSIGRYMAAVGRGVTLIVTKRGKPIAKVSPPDPEINSEPTVMHVLKKLEAEGYLKIGKGKLRKFRPIPTRGKPASQMIIEDRR